MIEACGNCNWHGATNLEEGPQALCLIDGNWHKTDFTCSHWTTYLHNISADARMQMASDKKNRQDAQKIQPKKYFLDKVVPILLTAVLSIPAGIITGLTLRRSEISELKKDIQILRNQMPEIPVTVIDPGTKNQLYIGRPIPKPMYYEFPITLNDGQGAYRIDQYRWFNEFKGVLIIQKPETTVSNPNDKILNNP